MESMDKIVEDLKDTARRHNSKMLHWHVNNLRGSSQSGLVLVNYRNVAIINDKTRVKERWAEHFENVLNQKKFLIPLMRRKIYFLGKN